MSPAALVLAASAKRHRSVAQAVREVNGLEVQDLADRLGLPRSTVSMTLLGSRRYYGHVRRALEAELGLDPYELDAIIPTPKKRRRP